MTGPFWLVLLAVVTAKEPGSIKSGGVAALRAIAPSGPVATASEVRHTSEADAAASDYAVPADNGAAPGVPADIEIVHLDPNMVFQHVIVGADGVVSPAGDGANGVSLVAGGGGTAAAGERIIYSNTLGIDGIRFPSGALISDDISTTAPVGCKLTKFSFKVLGRVVPTDPGGPFTVDFALYDNCPQAVTATQRLHYTDDPLPDTGIKLRGADGQVTFADDAPRTISFVVPDDLVVPIPTNLWLGVKFNRSNCGVVVGAPAMVGHSADIWDFPGFPCAGTLGGFPEQAHASLWAEVYGGADCPDTFLGYRASQANGPKISEGASVPFFDDIKLIVNNCLMTGYEVAVRGQGWYTFSLYRDCLDSPSSLIPGTDRTFNVGLSTKPQLQLARFSFDPPIQLTTDALYFRFTVNNIANGGVVLAGIQPTIGSSGGSYFIIDQQSQACTPKVPPPPSPLTGVFHASITCGGSPPLGACCDMTLTQCVGGTDDGKRCPCDSVCLGGIDDARCCQSSANCTAPGTCGPYCAAPGRCERVCREVPRINCPWPPRNQDQYPKWQLGATCDANPFPLACGLAACCLPDDTCENLTQNECLARVAPGEPILWQPGAYCAVGWQYCPFSACLAQEGSCTIRHPLPGCSDPNCCTAVCNFDDWCCHVEWDDLCIRWSDAFCIFPPGNDECAPDARRLIDGAVTIPVPGSATTYNRMATSNPTDPGFCCHNGMGVCSGGPRDSLPCVVPADCPGPGFCPDLQASPGLQGLKTVWFKFVQPQGFTSALIHTCDSNSPAEDSLLQVFKPGDNSSPYNACRTLSVIGCNDDATGCSSGGRNSKLYVNNLVAGETYYILLGTKTEDLTTGGYRVTVAAGCTGGDVTPNDYCPNATTVTDGATPFYINVNTCVGGVNTGKPCMTATDCPSGTCPANQHTVTFDCPAEPCVPRGLNDLWNNYTATCTGQARFETCAPPGETGPNTTLAVYADCTKCPPASGPPVRCDDDAYGDCGAASRVEFGVQLGECFKVRLADSLGVPVSGNLTVTCISDDCQPNGVPDIIEINAGTAPDCNHNGVPDECDIRDGVVVDGNGNGIPDQCEICPSGPMILLDPPDRVVDARQPHPPGEPDTLQGIDTFMAIAFEGARPSCWALCESNLNPSLHPPYPAELAENAIASVEETQPGRYTLRLKRPITPGEMTTITYRDDLGESSIVRVFSHPGNVNADSAAAPADVLDLIDALNGIVQPVWGLYSADCDHSGLIAPADVLCVIDLLNAGWNGTARPSRNAPCP